MNERVAPFQGERKSFSVNEQTNKQTKETEMYDTPTDSTIQSNQNNASIQTPHKKNHRGPPIWRHIDSYKKNCIDSCKILGK